MTDPLAQRASRPEIEAQGQPARKPLHQAAAIGRQGVATLRIAYALPDRFFTLAAKREQVGPAQAAPGAPEHSQPAEPVARMQQRHRQADQVLTELRVIQTVDLHCARR